MNHSFNVQAASYLGIDAAIVLNNLCFWCDKNKANGKHFHDGQYWTFNSVSAFSKLFPYLSSKKIRNALNKLERKGLVLSGRFNSRAYDRTKWYSVTKTGYEVNSGAIFPTGQMELPSGANAFYQKGEPIPDINTNINSNENHTTSMHGTDDSLFFADQLDPDKYPMSRDAFEIFREMKKEGAWNLYDGPLPVRDWDRVEELLNTAMDGASMDLDYMFREAYNERYRTGGYLTPNSINLCYFLHGYDDTNDGNRLLHMSGEY